jgi:hypothetical protein
MHSLPRRQMKVSDQHPATAALPRGKVPPVPIG